MEFDHPLRSRNLNNPFRRCVVNCPTTNPDCPPCAEDEECVLIGQSCDSCAKTICVAPPKQDDDDSGGGGSNAGAIAGGVVGGVVLVAIICLALWFYNRKRKSMAIEETNPNGFEKRDNFYGTERVARSRVGSMASTVMTRASNVIQIAYIPGVTNRSPPDTPGLVPPVPPIPGAGSPHSDQHYFLPGDIRDSVWSEMSEDQRKSISPSLARSSVATTIYRNNAIVSPIPAQQAMRAKAAMVSVKSGNSTPGSLTPGSAAPAVPAITSAQLHKAQQNTLGVSPIVARSGVARPVNVGKPRSKPDTISEEGEKSIPTVTVEDASSTEQSSSSGNHRQSSQSNAVTEIDDSPAIRQSPFADPQSPIEQSSKPTGTSSAIPQEMSSHEGGDSKRASTHRKRNSQSSAQLLQEIDASRRSASPFGDENEVK